MPQNQKIVSHLLHFCIFVTINEHENNGTEKLTLVWIFSKIKKNYFQKVTFGLLVHWTFKETFEGEEESINKLNQMKGRDPVLKHKKKMNQKNSQNHEKFHIGCVYKSWHFSFLDLFSLPCNRGKNLMSMRCSTWSVAFFECLRKWNLLNSYCTLLLLCWSLQKTSWCKKSATQKRGFYRTHFNALLFRLRNAFFLGNHKGL